MTGACAVHLKPKLILTVGLPRSGKSSWARHSGYPIVCPDAIRLALHGQRFLAQAEPLVWAHAKLMVASLFEAGHRVVVLDACNTTKKRRDEWIDERWERECQLFNAGEDTCIDRAYATGRTDIISAISRMATAYEPPFEFEEAA